MNLTTSKLVQDAFFKLVTLCFHLQAVGVSSIQTTPGFFLKSSAGGPKYTNTNRSDLRSDDNITFTRQNTIISAVFSATTEALGLL